MLTTQLRFLFTLFLSTVLSATVTAKDQMHYKRFTMQDGLPHRVITKIVQDRTGYIWLGTYNGLCRFDGEQFETFNLTSENENIGRISSIGITTTHKVWVKRDSDEREYLLNTCTGFLEPTNGETYVLKSVDTTLDENYADSTGLHIVHDFTRFDIPYESTIWNSNSRYLGIFDRQGNLWASFDDALYCISFSKAAFETISNIDDNDESLGQFKDEVRAMLQLRDGGFLLACKNQHIYKYDKDWHLEGYLTRDGSISCTQRSFGTKVYTMRQDSCGHIWLGSRGDGLFRVSNPDLDAHLRSIGEKTKILQYSEPLLNSNDIYDICLIDSCQILLATWRSGIQKLQTMCDGTMSEISDNKESGKLRHITRISDDIFALCSKSGLFFIDGQLNTIHKVGKTDFSYLMQSADGTYYASSFSNGVFTFHLPERPTQSDIRNIQLKPFLIEGLDNDILTMSQTADGMIRFVSDDAITRYDPKSHQSMHFDQSRWQRKSIYGEADPLYTHDAVILGTSTGICRIQSTMMQAHNAHIAINSPDTLHLIWKHETPVIRAVSIDYRLPRAVQYAWRNKADTTWHFQSNNGNIKLPDLWPGMHEIEICSTDSRGVWADNARTIHVEVSVSLWQWIQIGGLLTIIILVVFLIRKARHPKILKTIEAPVISGIQPVKPVVEERDKQFIENATHAVEEHISDPDLDVETLAEHMGLSRTILYTRFKETLNATPAAFINEIRMKRAIQLITARQHRISEIAILCGYSDPKYFARIFKQKVGVTPGKYLAQGKED